MDEFSNIARELKVISHQLKVTSDPEERTLLVAACDALTHLTAQLTEQQRIRTEKVLQGSPSEL